GQRAYALFHCPPASPARARRQLDAGAAMDQEAVSTLPDTRARPARPRPLKRLWKRLRGPLARSRAARAALVFLFAGAIRFVYRANRPAAGSDDIDGALAAHTPAIAAFWHGQHILAPAANPRGHRMVALFSRSADAELTARVAERLGSGVIRG